MLIYIAALYSVNQHAMPSEFPEKWGTVIFCERSIVALGSQDPSAYST